MVLFFSISQHKIWIFSWILTLTTFVKERVTVRFPASRGLSRRGKNERKPRRERPLLAGKLLGSHQWKRLDPIKRIQRSPTMTNMSGPFTFESLQRTCAHELYQTKIRLNYFVPLNYFGPQFQESVNKHHITCLGKHLFLLVKDSL